jgi:hypothetical protein
MNVIFILWSLLNTLVIASPCEDSDDGKNLQNAGQVLVQSFTNCDQKKINDCVAVSSLEKDFCTDSQNLREYWCEAGNLKGETVLCPRGCADSRCK